MAATWEQFESEPGFWVKPSAHTKQRKVHKVPLGPAAIELLGQIRAGREATSPRSRQSSFVFPGQLPGQPLTQHLDHAGRTVASERRRFPLWADSRDPKIAALVADLENGLRPASILTECRAIADQRGLNLPPGLSDAAFTICVIRSPLSALAAASAFKSSASCSVTPSSGQRRRYAHLADDPLREAAAKITAQIAGAGKNKPNVVPLPKRGGAA